MYKLSQMSWLRLIFVPTVLPAVFSGNYETVLHVSILSKMTSSKLTYWIDSIRVREILPDSPLF